MNSETILLTPEGMARLREEMNHLIKTEKPDILRRLAEARAHGDLSENAEYHAAKERKAHTENRIHELNSILLSAEEHTPDPAVAKGRCVFGSYVVIVDLDSDKKRNFQLVSSFEADGMAGRLSISSPLGQAIIGREAGDIVDVPVPAGTIEYEILEVSYPD